MLPSILALSFCQCQPVSQLAPQPQPNSALCLGWQPLAGLPCLKSAQLGGQLLPACTLPWRLPHARNPKQGLCVDALKVAWRDEAVRSVHGDNGVDPLVRNEIAGLQLSATRGVELDHVQGSLHPTITSLSLDKCL